MALEARLTDFRRTGQAENLDAFVDMVQQETFHIWDIERLENGKKPSMSKAKWQANIYRRIELAERSTLKERLRHVLSRGKERKQKENAVKKSDSDLLNTAKITEATTISASMRSRSTIDQASAGAIQEDQPVHHPRHISNGSSIDYMDGSSASLPPFMHPRGGSMESSVRLPLAPNGVQPVVNLHKRSVSDSAEPTKSLPRSKMPQPSPFYGREQELTKIQKAMESNVLGALIGPAGSGKSHLATNFCHQWVQEKPANRFVIWLDAKSETSLRDSYQAACRRLANDEAFPTANKRMQLSIEDSAHSLLNILLDLDESYEWIVVYDNVPESVDGIDGPEGFEKWFFPPGWWNPPAKVLLTTRHGGYAGGTKCKSMANITAVRVGLLPEDAAISMFRAELSSEDSDGQCEATKALVKRLCYLPLAILAAKDEIRECNLTVDKYLKKGDFAKVNDKVDASIRGTLTNAYSNGMDSILDVAAYVNGDKIQLELLGGDAAHKAVTDLCQWNLLTKLDGEPFTYTMHCLYQAAARTKRSAEPALLAVYNQLRRFDEDRPDASPLPVAMIPHVESMMEREQDIPLSLCDRWARVLQKAAIVKMKACNDLHGAKIMLHKALGAQTLLRSSKQKGLPSLDRLYHDLLYTLGQVDMMIQSDQGTSLVLPTLTSIIRGADLPGDAVSNDEGASIPEPNDLRDRLGQFPPQDRPAKRSGTSDTGRVDSSSAPGLNSGGTPSTRSCSNSLYSAPHTLSSATSAYSSYSSSVPSHLAPATPIYIIPEIILAQMPASQRSARRVTRALGNLFSGCRCASANEDG